MSDQPPQRRSSKGGFAIVRPGTGVPQPPTPPLPRTTTDAGTPLRSDPGAAPAAYDGFLTPVAAPAAAPTSTPPRTPTTPPAPPSTRTPTAPPAPPPSAMTPEMSAALAALKRAPTNPPRHDPSSPSSPPSSSLPPPPSSQPPATPSRPVLPTWAPAEGAEANPWAALEPLPPPEPRDWGRLLRRAGIVLGVVAVVGGGWAVATRTGGGESGGGTSAGGVLDDAVQCKQTLVRGRDLICIAPPSTLTELPPAERDARLARARTLGIFAGMNRIVFEDNGRTWRTLVLTPPPGTTTPTPGAPAAKPATPAPATPAPATPAPATPAPSTGPVDTTAP